MKSKNKKMTKAKTSKKVKSFGGFEKISFSSAMKDPKSAVLSVFGFACNSASSCGPMDPYGGPGSSVGSDDRC